MPTRKCAACGRRSERKDLLRFVLSGDSKAGDEIVFDEKQVSDGRGAYLHKQRSCVFAPGVCSLLRASLLKTKLGKKSKKEDETESIKQTLQDWSGLEEVLSSLEASSSKGKSQSKIRL